MIEYTKTLDHLTADMLNGFFVGWPNPPSRSTHIDILRNSYLVWLAVDSSENKVIGFINAISDGILAAYIPLLEVLPEYRKQGVGKELVTRMLESLKDMYMVDLLCDAELQKYYQKLGMMSASGACIRNYARQSYEQKID